MLVDMIYIPVITGTEAESFITKADSPAEVQVTEQQIEIYIQMRSSVCPPKKYLITKL